MPSRWEVALKGPVDAPVPLTAPQAVVSGWLDDQRGSVPGPGGAARSPHDAAARSWACGPLRAALTEAGTTVTVLEVRLLDDGLAERLVRAACPGRPVRLGAGDYLVAAPPRETSRASWAELQGWQGERAWQVRFATPVCLRRGNRTTPWPAPESIARGLAERWQRLDPASAPPPVRGVTSVWVSDIEGHSEAVILSRKMRGVGQTRVTEEVVCGFVGRIRYVCDHGTDEEAACFSALLAFAAYAGAGSHTTYGFGTLCPEPTWQPPTVQPSRRVTHPGGGS